MPSVTRHGLVRVFMNLSWMQRTSHYHCKSPTTEPASASITD
jgi:hypothetical protein